MQAVQAEVQREQSIGPQWIHRQQEKMIAINMNSTDNTFKPQAESKFQNHPVQVHVPGSWCISVAILCSMEMAA